MIKDFRKTIKKKKWSVIFIDILQLPHTVISNSEKLTHPNAHAQLYCKFPIVSLRTDTANPRQPILLADENPSVLPNNSKHILFTFLLFQFSETTQNSLFLFSHFFSFAKRSKLADLFPTFSEVLVVWPDMLYMNCILRFGLV